MYVCVRTQDGSNDHKVSSVYRSYIDHYANDGDRVWAVSCTREMIRNERRK